MRNFLTIWILLFASIGAHAATPSFPLLNQANLDDVLREFSSNSTYTSASPPRSFGKRILPLVGFEVGIVGGVTKSPAIDNLVAGTDVKYLPHAGILMAGSFPLGLAAEFLFIPEKTVSDVTIKTFGFAAKWTVTDVFWQWLPVNLAARFHIMSSDLSYSQTINNSSTNNIEVDGSIIVEADTFGFNVSAGYPLGTVVEPYLGVGFVSATGALQVDATGTATVLGNDVSLSQTDRAEVDNSSLHVFGGVQFHLFVMNIGFEAARTLAATSYTVKVSFEF